jgi:serine/threonine protein kinase
MFNSTYDIIEEIGKGQFGTIYKGLNRNTKEEVAIKIEKKDIKMLKRESNIYLLLSKEEGFPRVKWYGATETFYYMVMDLLGVSLAELKHRSDEIHPIIIKRLGKKMIRLVEKVHKYDMLHRDIKPDNFLFDNVDYDKLFLIDFGLSKTYKTEKHIPEKEISDIIGTPGFVSLNVHAKRLPSRRDDLESVVYILCYLFLPFEKWKEDLEFKKSLDTMVSEPLQKLLKYTRGLKYEEAPLYDHMIEIIETI